MRIYLAGLIVGRTFSSHSNTTSENVIVSEEVRANYPWELESYYYLSAQRWAPDYFRTNKKSIFLDSGAFSMFTQGVHVDLQAYADYLKDNHDWIHVASNLDEIGQGKEQQSYNNQKTLERMGATICPVHHARDADSWLLKYLAEGYDYIFLGGMVPETTPYLRQWLDRLWGTYLTRKDGSAKVKVHGFGLTTLELIRRYPWYSVDSTSWVMTSRYGSIFLDLPHRDIKINISSDAGQIHDLDQHYDHLAPAIKNAVAMRIRELGYDPELLRTHYGWRDRFNVEYFLRLMQRPDPKFIWREQTLFG